MQARAVSSGQTLLLQLQDPDIDELRRGALESRVLLEEASGELVRTSSATLLPFSSFLAVPVFFGDPVAMDENESSITYWHCGAAACSLARKDTGAAVGVHPNRKIGPAMDFGCEAFQEATIFRIGRKPDGSFRFFIAEGAVLDKPKQFIGTSIVVKTDRSSRQVVEQSIRAGFEPHFAVVKGRHAETLQVLADMLGLEVCRY